MKVDNEIVEIFELSVVESDFVLSSGVREMLKANERADADALLSMQSHLHD